MKKKEHELSQSHTTWAEMNTEMRGADSIVFRID